MSNCVDNANCDFCDARCAKYIWDVERIFNPYKKMYYDFCPQCHYFLWGNTEYAHYCPNCGIHLTWENQKITDELMEHKTQACEQYYQYLLKEFDNGSKTR
jgi:predicted RNA-binding Zn-ribbon protein involved in translation (DUF1610 family)